MPALTPNILFGKLRSALPHAARFDTPTDAIHPALVTIPGFGRARIYLWTVTADRSTPGARPPGEYKIQLILPTQGREQRGRFEFDDGYTALLGYSPDYGVFVGWEAWMYTDFAYSRNVQVREELLREASTAGWSVAPPRRQPADEVRVAFTPGNLVRFLRASREADERRTTGTWREAFFLARTPNYESHALPRTQHQLEEHIRRERDRVVSSRAFRDARFAPKVKEQYDFSCAACGIQLEIVEGAHIIPVSESESTDEVWNGIALCPNHHRLFDSRTYAITADLVIKVDVAAVEFLRESGRSEGVEILTGFDNRGIRAPRFWSREPRYRNRMQAVLERRLSLSGLA